MLERELTYRMPFERLAKLSRVASRKAFSTSWLLLWVLFGVYLGLLAVLVIADGGGRLEQATGIPWGLWQAMLFGGLLGGFLLLRRHGRRLVKGRADYDSAVTLRQEPGGLRFATPEIEYYVKWNGISQMMMHDGVVISHGSMFFLVPDEAFADEGERNAFARDVFGRLSDAARERSEKLVRPVLGAASSTTRIQGDTT